MLASGYTCACLRARRSPRGQELICLHDHLLLCQRRLASLGVPASRDVLPAFLQTVLHPESGLLAGLPACLCECLRAGLHACLTLPQAGRSSDRHIRRQACQQMRRHAREQAGGLARERGGRFACLPARSPACGQACLAVVHGQTCLPAHQLPCLQAGMPAFLHAVVRVARSCWQACLPA